MESRLEIVKFFINASEKVAVSLFRVGSVKSHVVKISFNIDFINDNGPIISITIRRFGYKIMWRRNVLQIDFLRTGQRRKYSSDVAIGKVWEVVTREFSQFSGH
jgi:hypothetical protein